MSQLQWFICVNAIFVLFAENILLFWSHTKAVPKVTLILTFYHTVSISLYLPIIWVSECVLLVLHGWRWQILRFSPPDRLTIECRSLQRHYNNKCGKINIQSVQIPSEVYLKSSEFSNYTKIRKSFETWCCCNKGNKHANYKSLPEKKRDC